MPTCRGQVLSTIDELRTITTHDDNLERQYKEGEVTPIICDLHYQLFPPYVSFLHNDTFAVVSENVQLNSALEKARGEIRVHADKSSYLFSIL